MKSTPIVSGTGVWTVEQVAEYFAQAEQVAAQADTVAAKTDAIKRDAAAMGIVAGLRAEQQRPTRSPLSARPGVRHRAKQKGRRK